MSNPASIVDSLAVQNVVASTAIDTELALEPLAADLDGATYTTGTPACTYTPPDIPATVRLFRSGTLMVMGAPSRPVARKSLTQTVEALDELGIAVPATPETTILNMVFTADLDTMLNLPAVSVGLGLEQTEYEPEQNPAVIYRPADPAVVMLLFPSGKLVLTGTTDTGSAETALTVLADQLTDLGLRES